MTTQVLQLRLMGVSPLLGPLLIGFGTWILLLWYLDRKIVPPLKNESTLLRILIIIFLDLGIILATVGFLLYIERLWAGVLFLFTLGRMIEAGVLVYGLRKVWHYLGKTIKFLFGQSSGGIDALAGVLRHILFKTKYNVVTATLALLLGTGIFALSHLEFNNPISISLRYAAGVFIAVTVGSALLWHIQKTNPHINFPAAFGILLCIVGAEVYDYPNDSFPLAHLIPGVSEQTIVTIDILVPFYDIWFFTEYLLGQLAFILGLLISISFVILTSNRKPAPEPDKQI